MEFWVYIIAVLLGLLKLGFWIWWCSRRQSSPAQEGVIIRQPSRAVIQTRTISQWDRYGLIANELQTPTTSPEYGFQTHGHASQYTDRNGLIAKALPTKITSPHYGFQAQGHASEYTDRTGLNANELPTGVTPPEYGFQADEHASQYTNCSGTNIPPQGDVDGTDSLRTLQYVRHPRARKYWYPALCKPRN